MTETLINSAIIVATLYATSHAPWIKRLLGSQSTNTQHLLFKVMVGVLYVFSLHETINEDGFLYGVTFSLIPLVAGAVVLSSMRSRQAVIPQSTPFLGTGDAGVIADDSESIQ